MKFKSSFIFENDRIIQSKETKIIGVKNLKKNMNWLKLKTKMNWTIANEQTRKKTRNKINESTFASDAWIVFIKVT